MRFAEQWSWCTVEADPRRDAHDPRIQTAPRERPRAALPGRQPYRRYRADRRTAGAALLFAGGEQRSRHLSHRGAAGAGQPRRLARHVEFASRARGSKLQIRRPCSKSTGRRKNYCLIAGGIGITPITGIAAALRRRNIDAPLHYAVKSRGDAAFLDELSALLGDRLIVHASDEGARLDLDATFRASA